MKTVTLDARAWNSDVLVIFGGGRKRWRKFLTGHRVPDDQAAYWCERMEATDHGRGQCGAVTMFTEDTPWHVYVYLNAVPKLGRIEDICTVTHELMHATIAILRRKGVTLCQESEEAFTYLTEHLTRQLWEKSRKLERPRKGHDS